MQKGQVLIFLIVGILILAGVGVALFYTNYSNNRIKVVTPQSTPQSTSSPSPSDASPAPTGTGETVNWKTYTNNKYQYSVKYPMPAILLGGMSGGDEYLGIDITHTNTNVNSPLIVHIHVVNGSQYDLSKYINKYTVAQKITPRNNITLIMHADAGLDGDPIPTETAKQYLINIFNKMLSTLKFL